MAAQAMFNKYHRQQIGQAAESVACQYLITQGLVLLEKNWHCRYGEIDLIMQDTDGTLVFVEVRSRKAHSAFDALSSITPKKQAKIHLTADCYLQRFATPVACRCDVVAMCHFTNAIEQACRYTIDWIKNAF